MKLHLDDNTYDMAPLDRKATLYAKGVTYTAKVGGLAWGPLQAPVLRLRWYTRSLYPVGARPHVRATILMEPAARPRNAQVKPHGGPDTEFLFKVRYNDDDNEPPSTIQLFLDDKAYDMVQTKASDAYYKGVYYQVAVTGLACGPHSYALPGRSPHHDHTPRIRTHIGGEDEGRNYQPEITDWEVEPWDGAPTPNSSLPPSMKTTMMHPSTSASCSTASPTKWSRSAKTQTTCVVPSTPSC